MATGDDDGAGPNATQPALLCAVQQQMIKTFTSFLRAREEATTTVVDGMDWDELRADEETQKHFTDLTQTDDFRGKVARIVLDFEAALGVPPGPDESGGGGSMEE